MSAYQNRIVKTLRIPASQLKANPKNWRVHTDQQRKAMRAVLERVGWVAPFMAREDQGEYQLIDGHLRLELAGEQEVTVNVVDLSDEEADAVLLSYDPLSAMAGADTSNLQALLESVSFEDPALTAMLDELAARSGIADVADIEGWSEPDPESNQKMRQLTFYLTPQQYDDVLAVLNSAIDAGHGEGETNIHKLSNALAWLTSIAPVSTPSS